MTRQEAVETLENLDHADFSVVAAMLEVFRNQDYMKESLSQQSRKEANMG